MARRKKSVSLNVYMNSRLVGRLDRAPSGAISFTYATSWLAWDKTLPISLSLPLRENRHTGEAVVAWFDNLLPDGDQMRRQIAERVHAEGYDAASLLAAIGRDCVGALQFLPDGIEPGTAGVIAGTPISDEAIARRISDLARAPLGITENDDFRISIAGTQEKTALLKLDGQWQLPLGATATTHIIKPPLGMLANGTDMCRSVENEHFCMRLLSALDIPTAKTEIIDIGAQRVLCIERFDRLWTADGRLLRLPQEDFCQALGIHPSRKYESDGGPGIASMLEVLKGSDHALDDRKMLLKAQVAYWLLGATDGHAKNFSIHLWPHGRYHMTPLYDVMSIQPAVDAGQLRHNRLKLAMAVGDNRHYAVSEIQPRHYRQIATANGIPDATVDEIFSELRHKLPDAIEETTKKLSDSVPQDLMDSICGGVMRRLRLLESDEPVSR